MKDNIENKNNSDLNLNNKKGLKLSSQAFIPKVVSNSNFLNNLNSKNVTNTNNFSYNRNINNFYNPLTNFEKNKFDNNNNNIYNQFSYDNKNIQNSKNENFINLLNEQKTIKISLDTNVKSVISYIIEYFQNDNNDTIYLTGLNLAISKVILIAEIVKIKIRNLHQINNMDCLITDNSNKVNKENDEGDLKRIPKFEIILTKKEPLVKGFGYQNPLTDEEIRILSERLLNNSVIKKERILVRKNIILTKKISNLQLNHRERRRKFRVLKLKSKNIKKIQNKIKEQN